MRELARGQIVQPGDYGPAIRLIEDSHHGATEHARAFFFEQQGEFFELPAFGQRDGSALKRHGFHRCHGWRLRRHASR